MVPPPSPPAPARSPRYLAGPAGFYGDFGSWGIKLRGKIAEIWPRTLRLD